MNVRLWLIEKAMKIHCFEIALNWISTKKRIHEVILPIQKWKKKNPNGVFLVMTPEHGNLGDHAIAYAERELLQKHSIPLYEITGAKLRQIKGFYGLDLLNSTPILLNGGGNLGTLWPDEEKIIREVITCNPDSDIIICPNTIYYETDLQGKKSLAESIEIYNSHKSLNIFAREKISYDFMKKIYRGVHLAPDMVLTLPPQNSHIARKGCLLVLRSDVEKTLSEKETKRIADACNRLFDEVIVTDMVVPHKVLPVEREKALKQKWEEFSGAELVVTDRLHGMIFAAITETPCIVLNSKSPKVNGCYEWIKNLGYIRFVESSSEIASAYQEIQNLDCIYDNTDILHMMLPLETEILKLNSESVSKDE